MSRINVEQLAREIRRLERHQLLYRVLKRELSLLGYWQNKPRGDMVKTTEKEEVQTSTSGEIGEIRQGKEIGRNGASKYELYIWQLCYECGEPRWAVLRRKDKPCRPCARKIWGRKHRGENSGNWHGGIKKVGDGYVAIRVAKEDFFFSMADAVGYVREHRLVMAKHLNRCLLRWEIVHHKNGIKNDNRLENLELLPEGRHHLPSMQWRQEIVKRDKKIAQLEKQP